MSYLARLKKERNTSLREKSRPESLSRQEVLPLPTEVAYLIQPWSDGQIWRALLSGAVVQVWSRTLERWTVWVRDDGVKRQVEGSYPETSVYTLAELETLVVGKCPPDSLRAIDDAKRILGGNIDSRDAVGK